MEAPKTRVRKTTPPPSKTAIAKCLREAVFNPREHGPLRVIADTGNPEYYVTRAVEFLQTAKLYGLDAVESRQELQKALGLIALALVTDAN